MGRSVWGEFGSGRVGVDKAAQRQRRYVLHVIVRMASMAATLCKYRSRFSTGTVCAMSITVPS
ncbi:MAG: hypothetical protein WA770_17615 [Pseudolabrys sp.]